MMQWDDYIPCPMDGGLIPEVGRRHDGPPPCVRFYWCKSCGLLFALVNGCMAAAVIEGYRAGERRVWEVYGPESNVRLAVGAVSHLGPV